MVWWRWFNLEIVHGCEMEERCEMEKWYSNLLLFFAIKNHTPFASLFLLICVWSGIVIYQFLFNKEMIPKTCTEMTAALVKNKHKIRFVLCIIFNIEIAQIKSFLGENKVPFVLLSQHHWPLMTMMTMMTMMMMMLMMMITTLARLHLYIETMLPL